MMPVKRVARHRATSHHFVAVKRVGGLTPARTRNRTCALFWMRFTGDKRYADAYRKTRESEAQVISRSHERC